MKSFSKFTKYSVITFVILFILSCIANYIDRIDEFILLNIPIRKALFVCLLTVTGLLTALFCNSISVATFLTFWRLNSLKWSFFFKSLAKGLIIIIPLSIGIYFYDWYLREHIMAASVKQYIEIKEYGSPQNIEYDFSVNIDKFLSDFPSTLPKHKILFRIDSLKNIYRSNINACRQTLLQLPDSMATEAYKTYHLHDLGVEYRYAEKTTISNDSLCTIQNNILYQQATRLAENSTVLQRYLLEYYERSANTLWIYICYLILALSGFLLRYQPLKKILAALAILIFITYASITVNSYGKIYTHKVLKTVRKIENNQRNAYQKIHEKTKNSIKISSK